MPWLPCRGKVGPNRGIGIFSDNLRWLGNCNEHCLENGGTKMQIHPHFHSLYSEVLSSTLPACQSLPASHRSLRRFIVPRAEVQLMTPLRTGRPDG